MKQVLFYLLFSFFLILPDLQAQSTENQGTVVCLHGFFQSSRRMMPIGYNLKNVGLDVILWDYPSWHKTIEEHAEDLVHLLNKIALEKPGEPIHFVTHSLGGIITRAAVSHPDCPPEAKIGKAVLIAPPNKGSCLGRKMQDIAPLQWIMGPQAGNQILTYSKEEMENVGNFPLEMDVFVIAGVQGSNLYFSVPNDGKLTVTETYLSTPHTHITTNASHTWILRSREVLEMISSILLEQ